MRIRSNRPGPLPAVPRRSVDDRGIIVAAHLLVVDVDDPFRVGLARRGVFAATAAASLMHSFRDHERLPAMLPAAAPDAALAPRNTLGVVAAGEIPRRRSASFTIARLSGLSSLS